MSGMTATRLPYTDYYLPSGGLGTQNGKGNGRTVLLNYTILNLALKNGKMHTIAVGNTRSNWAGYGLDTLD